MNGTAPLDDPLDHMRTCDHCEGAFLPDDMDGDHCRECSDMLFGDEE